MKPRKIVALLLFVVLISANHLFVSKAHAQNKVKFYDSGSYFSESDKTLVSDAYALELNSDWHNILHIIVSPDLDLDDFKEKRITDKCEQLKNQFNLAGFDPLNCIIIIINPKKEQSEVIFRDLKIKIDDEIITNINILFLLENLNGNKHSIAATEAINLVIKELKKVSIEAPILRDNKNKLYVDDTSFSSRYWNFFYVVMLISLFHLAYYYVKYKKPGHHYETKKFNALDRLSKTVRIMLTVIVVIGLAFFLFHYIYFFGEFLFVITILLFLYIPITNFIFYVGFVIKDIIKVTQKNDNFSSEDLPLLPAIFLLRPDVTSFQLLELVLESLVFREQLLLIVEWKEFRNGRERKYIRIEKAPGFDIRNAKSYELPLLLPFKDLEMEYGYYLNEYIGLIDSNLIGLKHFKKDLVSNYLIKRGLLLKKEWVFNIYKPSEKGLEFITKLKKVSSNMGNELLKRVNDKNAFKQIVNQANDKLLLIDNLTQVLNNKLDTGQLSELLSLNDNRVNFLLNEEYNNDAFDEAVGLFFKEKIYSGEAYEN